MTKNGIKARRVEREEHGAKHASRTPDPQPKRSAAKRTAKKRTAAELLAEICSPSEGLTKLLEVHKAESDFKLDYPAMTNVGAIEALLADAHRRITSLPQKVTGMALTVAIHNAEVSPEYARVAYSSASSLGKLMIKGRSCTLTRKFPVFVPAEDDPAGYRIAIGVSVLDLGFDGTQSRPSPMNGLQSGRAIVSRVDVPQFDWKSDPSDEDILLYVRSWMNTPVSVRQLIAAEARASTPTGWARSPRDRRLMSFLIDTQSTLAFALRGDGIGKAIVSGARLEAEDLVKPNKKLSNRRSRDEITHMIGYELRKMNRCELLPVPRTPG